MSFTHAASFRCIERTANMTNLVNTRLIPAEAAHETEKAYLFSFGIGYTGLNGTRDVWVPKSQVTLIEDRAYGDHIWVPAWLARKIGEAQR